MKVLIPFGEYTFDASAGTITFDSYGAITLEQVILVTNLDFGTIIYNFADPAKGGEVGTNVLYLEYDTTSMFDTDSLQIWYWNDDGPTEVVQPVAGNLNVTETNSASIAADVDSLGNTVLTEDVAAPSNPKGFATIARRRDSLSPETATDGHLVALNCTMNGELYVKHVDDLNITLSAGSNNIGDVDIASIAAGDNNIGNVDVLTVPADPFGANADALVSAGATGSISSKLRRTTQGLEDLKTNISLATGSNHIGEVSVNSMPSLSSGSNNIGDVDVLTVPTDPFGQNNDSAATAGSIGTMQAKFRLMTSQLDAIKTSNELIDDTVKVLGTDTYTEASTKGLAIGAVRRDANTSLVDTTNEIAPLQVNATGELKVAQIQALPTGSNVIGALSSNQTVNLNQVVGTAVDVNSGNKSAGSQRVVIATDDVNLSAIKTSTELIDDTIKVFGTDTYSEATTKGQTIAAVRRDADTTLVDTTNEVAPLQVDARGCLKVEAFSGETLPVSLTSTTITGTVAVTDNSGSLTVDAPTGTPVNVQIGNATLVAGVIDETGSGAVDALAVGGGTAHDAVDSGNPIKVGFKAKNALPTAVANSDRADGISDLWGRPLVSHIDPAMQTFKSVNVTTTQTGTDVWSPTSGKKIAVTYLAVSAYATTAARVILWFGDNADTTYSAGTDQLLWAGSFAPSTTAKPMMVITFPIPIFCTTVDRELHLTTDAGISLDISVYGYEW